jgi:hypothetical protein
MTRPRPRNDRGKRKVTFRNELHLIAKTEDHVSAFFEIAEEYMLVGGHPRSEPPAEGTSGARMAKVLGRDPPAELIENVRAIVFGPVSILALS